MRTVGQCKLCYQHRELQESHIWSRFGYKRYASDVSHGGRFVDLRNGTRHNRQITEEWLCSECEQRLGKAETYTAQLLTNLEKKSEEPHEYDERLLYFVTSLSWRTALFHLTGRQGREDKQLTAAMRMWRRYLLGAEKDLRPYSQHLFVVFDKKGGLHRGLGGELCLEDGFILSHIGPLFMVGRFGLLGRPVSDIKVWQQSSLRPEGGTITPISEWRGGVNVTMNVINRLVKRVGLAIKTVKKMHAAEQV